MSIFLKNKLTVTALLCFSIAFLVLLFQIFYFSSEGRVLPIFLMLALVYTFYTIPLIKTSKIVFMRVSDYVLITGSIVSGLYLAINYDAIQQMAGTPSSTIIIMGIIALFVLLEAVRRIVGLPLTIIALFFLGYAFIGPYLPPILMHRGYDWVSIIDRLYLSSGGFYGLPLATMFRYVVLFVIFGSLLEKTGAGEFLINLSKSIAGKYRGGVGQISVVSSSLMGSISGSSVANVATTGPITIPAMKKTGFSPAMAGAVEAVASNGGQILPPVMGAAAFLMADFLGISYAEVMVAALIPALLYFIAVSMNIYLYSSYHNIRGLKKEEIPGVVNTIKSGWYYFIPFVVLIGMLLQGYSPTYSGLFAIASIVVLGFLKPKDRLKITSLFEALKTAGQNVMMLTIASGAAGIIVGILSLTGLGNRLSGVLISLSGESVLILLVLSMIVCIVLGMGMPTTVVYIMLATLVAPAIVDMGVIAIAAHLFIIYFGTMSMITPPVALASFAGAAIAGAEPVKTSLIALKIAIPCYIIPFYFVFNNGLLLQGDLNLSLFWSIFTALAGILSLSIALMGFFKRKLNLGQRVGLFVGSILLIHQSIVTDIISLGILLLFVIVEVKPMIQTRSTRAAK